MKIQSLLLSLAFLAGCAQSQATPEIAALNKRIDSLTDELRIIKTVLASKQLDVDNEWARLRRQDSVYNIPIAGTPIFGDPKAPLSVVLFTDLQCPYCAQIIPALKSLQASHPKSLNISFRHFPLTNIHEKAMFAHQNLWAAGQQGKFWEYYLAIAPNFRGLTDSALMSTAKNLKLNLARFETDRKSAAAAKAVTADMQLGESVGVDGTPAMFFKGKLTRNPNEINDAASKLDTELGK